MGKSRPARTEQRASLRAAKKLVRDRERLFLLEEGGSSARPIEVAATSVIEPRARNMACPQCDGRYRLGAEDAPSAGLRRLAVTCPTCGAARHLWFRVTSPLAN